MNQKTDKTKKLLAGVPLTLPTVILLVLVLLLGYRIGRKSAPVAGPAPQTASAKTEAKPEVWTCSMHPNVQLPRPGLCPICNMELIPLEEDDSETATGMRQLAVSENAKALMDIETTPVQRKFVTAVVRMSGKIEYDETNLSYITAWVPGRLDRLYIDYTGLPVREGDHMAMLYSPELIGAQEELLQALQSQRNANETDLGIMQDMARSTAQAAREKLRLWGLKPEQIADIEKTEKVSDHVTIYAPTSGIVIHKNAVEGMYVQTGTKIYTIADLTHVWVKLDAYESDLEWLRYGQHVEFTTISYPGEVFKGTISFIDPILNERTRTVKIRVNVPNPDGKLKPGMFTKAIVRAQVAGAGRIMDADLVGKWICPMHPEIIKPDSGSCDICQMPLVRTESLGYVSDDPALVEKPLVIPTSAALITGTRAIVYVRLPDTEKPTFEGRQIVLGPRAGDYYIVRSGLKEDELVVTRGNFKIDSSLQIMARPSMMTPDISDAHEHLLEAPPAFQYQLKTILAAAQNIEQVIPDADIAQIQQAFAQLATAVAAADISQLTGDAMMVFKEYAMRLTNDAVEGQHAKTAQDATRIASGMAASIDVISSSFGVQHDHSAHLRPAISDNFRDQLAKLFAHYFDIQRSLADDKPAGAADSADKALKALGGISTEPLTGADLTLWEKSAKDLRGILADIKAGGDIKTVRENFYLLSQHLTKTAKRFGSTNPEPFYIFHCPMAFDNSGAEWLQDNDQTKNPYFGHMMLRCGSATELIGPMDIWQEHGN